MEIIAQQNYAYKAHQGYIKPSVSMPIYSKHATADVFERTTGQKSVSFGSLSLLDNFQAF